MEKKHVGIKRSRDMDEIIDHRCMVYALFVLPGIFCVKSDIDFPNKDRDLFQPCRKEAKLATFFY